MGQLRKLLNVTLDNIQLSGGKLQKFLISDSGEDPVTTKVVLEFGEGGEEGGGQCVLHSAVTINLLEMTLECIEDSGGQLLTFLIEDNDSTMKVILEFHPHALPHNKTHDKRSTSKSKHVPNEGYKTYPPKQGDSDNWRRQHSYESHMTNVWNFPPSASGQRRHSIASTGVDSDAESIKSRASSPSLCVSDREKSQSSTCVSHTHKSTSPDKPKQSNTQANECAIKERILADKRAFLSGNPSDSHKQDTPQARNFRPEKYGSDFVSAPINAQEMAKSASVEELLNQNTPSLNNNSLKAAPSKVKPSPLPSKPRVAQAPLAEFKDGDINYSSLPKSPSILREGRDIQVKAQVHHIKDNETLAKNKHFYIGNGSPPPNHRDSQKVGNGATAKTNNNNDPKVGNSELLARSPKDEDLKSEAKDKVPPLPTIEKPLSPKQKKSHHHQPRRGAGMLKGARNTTSSSAATPNRRLLQQQDEFEDEEDDLDADSDDSIELISEIKTARPPHKRGVLVRRSTMFF